MRNYCFLFLFPKGSFCDTFRRVLSVRMVVRLRLFSSFLRVIVALVIYGAS